MAHVSSSLLNLQPLDGLTDALLYDVRRTATDTTLSANDGVVIVSAAIKPVYVALPPAAQNQGRAYLVKKVDPTANPVQLVCQQPTDTIDGSDSVPLTTPYDSRLIMSDGTQWLIMAQTAPGASGGGAAPANEKYVVMALSGALSQERLLTAGAGIVIADSGANAPVTISATAVSGAAGFIGNIIPSGSVPGTVFTLPVTPTLTLLVLNGLVLDQVAVPTHVDEFGVSGATVTTFRTITTTDKFKAYLGIGSGTFLGNQTPSGSLPGTSFTVPQLAGQNPVLLIVVVNGLVLNRVGAAPAVDDFTLVGNTLTTGRTMVATDKFKVYEWF